MCWKLGSVMIYSSSGKANNIKTKSLAFINNCIIPDSNNAISRPGTSVLILTLSTVVVVVFFYQWRAV